MKTFSFEEIGKLIVTLEAAEDVQESQVVKINGVGRVSACEEGDKFCGVAGKPNGNMVGVQMRGFAVVHYSGGMSPGTVGLVADGKGGVKAGDGTPVLVIGVYENKTAVIFM